jgi:hypothetical protein
MKRIIRQITRIFLLVIMIAYMITLPAKATDFYSLDANVISQGTALLKGTYLFNCETGTVGSSGDIWWNQISSTQRQMVPQSPAKILNLGIVDFNSLTATNLDDYTYSSTPIIGNNDSTNKLVTNDVFVVKTKVGHYTKIKVLSCGYNLSIQWVTYRAPLTTPSLVSPAAGQVLYNYPRNTTLSWKPVTGAAYYKIESQYYSSASWVAYPDVIVSGINNTSYTFNFVGDQKGRWRVTAYSSNTYSAPTGWREFSYSTGLQLSTPVLVSPINNVTLYNYPRTTTLTWKPVPGSTGYLVERQYYSGGIWRSYPTNVTVAGTFNTSYTFTFTGAQPGRWRVTALGASPYRNSSPSVWWTFTYTI